MNVSESGSGCEEKIHAQNKKIYISTLADGFFLRAASPSARRRGVATLCLQSAARSGARWRWAGPGRRRGRRLGSGPASAGPKTGWRENMQGGGSGQGEAFVFVCCDGGSGHAAHTVRVSEVPHQKKGGQIRKTKKEETQQKSGEGGNYL